MGVGSKEGLPGAPGAQPGDWGTREAMVGSGSPAPSLLRLPPVPPAPEGGASPVQVVPSEAWKTLIHTEARMHTSTPAVEDN